MTERKTKILEVGDVIYSQTGYGYLIKNTIIRVTPKMAFMKSPYSKSELKFKREIDPDFHFKEIGNTGFAIYWVETPKMKEMYHRQQLEMMFSEIKISELNNEQLTEILKIAGKGVA